MKNLVDHLKDGGLLTADGAAGTALMAAGLPSGMPPELWNAERPETILNLHRAYLEAGSQIILTNTFGGSRIKLDKSGLGERTRELNLAGAQIARQAAGENAYVAGDLGPTGELMAPFGSLTFEAAAEAYRQQAAALAEGGVDALWIETMTDLDETRAAVTGAKAASDLPVLVSLSFGARGRTMMGVSGKRAAEVLWPMGLAAIGANCGEGLEAVEVALQGMGEALPGVPLIAKANAGLPKLVDGNTIYDVSPEQFGERVAAFLSLGARIVGACCGSGPAHIAAISHAIQRS